MKIFYLLIISLLLSTSAFSQSAIIHGKITDEESGEKLIYANIVLYKNGVFTTGGSSDFEGNYALPVDPGTYEMRIHYTGYSERVITDIIIKSAQKTKLNIPIEVGDNPIPPFIVNTNDLDKKAEDNSTKKNTPIQDIKLDITMSNQIKMEIISICYCIPLIIDETEPSDIQKINSEDIRNRADKEIKQIISNMAGVSINNY